MTFEPGYEERVTLSDGDTLLLRAISPRDADKLREGFSRLSPESRYRRFFHFIDHLSDEMVERLTNVDGVKHVAIVALVETPDLKDEIGAGVGRFVCLPELPDVAEMAITVTDDFQRRGIGKILMQRLTQAALERGVRALRADVLAANDPMRSLLEHIGAELVENDGDVVTYDIPIATPHGIETMLKVLRGAAETMAILLRRWFRQLVSPGSHGGAEGS